MKNVSLAKILLTTICSPDHFEIQLALLYLKSFFQSSHAAHLEKIAIETRVFAYKDSENYIIDNINAYKPNIIGFSCYLWNIEKILKISKLLKEKDPEILIILGGPEVSPRPEEILKQEKAVDIIVIGEGEKTFVDVVNNFVCGKLDLSEIKGIAYRKEGNILITPKRPLMKNINRVPSPYLTGLVDIRHKYVQIETMRGCPNRCAYCCYHKNFDKLRFFSLRRIESELKFILAKEPTVVYLMDPTFNIYPQRAKEILRFFIKYNKNSKLHTELRAELLDEEMVDLLSKARVSKLEIGLQSIHQDTLKNINRTLKKGLFKRNLRLLNNKKILYEVHLIDALPGHTFEKLKQCLDWLIALRPPVIVIMQLLVLPGSFLHQQSKRLGIEFKSKPNYAWIKTASLSERDNERIERLRDSMISLYIGGLLRNTIFFLANQLNISISTILDEYGFWIKKTGGKKSLFSFIRSLCRKYKRKYDYKKALCFYKKRF